MRLRLCLTEIKQHAALVAGEPVRVTAVSASAQPAQLPRLDGTVTEPNAERADQLNRIAHASLSFVMLGTPDDVAAAIGRAEVWIEITPVPGSEAELAPKPPAPPATPTPEAPPA